MISFRHVDGPRYWGEQKYLLVRRCIVVQLVALIGPVVLIDELGGTLVLGLGVDDTDIAVIFLVDHALVRDGHDYAKQEHDEVEEMHGVR